MLISKIKYLPQVTIRKVIWKERAWKRQMEWRKSWSQNPLCHTLTLTCDIQTNGHMPYIKEMKQNIQLHCTKFFYIKHHKSWTDLLHLNSLKVAYRMVLGFCSLLAFRQCCCLKVDTRHNILKQSQQQGSKWIWAFLRCQSWGCCKISPSKYVKLWGGYWCLREWVTWRDMHLYDCCNGKQCSFPSSNNTVLINLKNTPVLRQISEIIFNSLKNKTFSQSKNA